MEIKNNIDPLNTHEVTTQQFMRFLDHYWYIPNNRNNVFKYRFKAIKPIPNLVKHYKWVLDIHIQTNNKK